ncbi:MAG: DUF4292 domain-containing protein [Bacteroidota bacterium]
MYKLLPLFALIFIIGCGTAPKPAVNEAMSPDELKNVLVQSTVASKNFSAEGTITVNSPRMNQSAGFDLLTRGTDSVKMTVYGPFGFTVGSALFTRSEFTAYNALNNTVYRGNPAQQMKMLPFINDIPVELLISSLQGNHPLLPSAAIDSLEVSAGRFYTFTSPVNDSTYDRFTVQEDFLRITRCVRKTISGRTLWKVEYTYKRSAEGAVIPEQVEVTIPSKDASLLLEYSSITNDDASSPMRIAYPEDAEVITIE